VCDSISCVHRKLGMQKLTCASHAEPVTMPAEGHACNTGSLSEPLVTSRGDKSVDKEVLLCRICEQSGSDVIRCGGPCFGMYHAVCTGHSSHDGSYLCEECYTGKSAFLTFFTYQLSDFISVLFIIFILSFYLCIVLFIMCVPQLQFIMIITNQLCFCCHQQM